jgi:tetratricopeptide (TPR) repeat protein
MARQLRAGVATAAVLATALAVPLAAIAEPKDPKAAKRWLAVGQTLMQRGAYLVARNRADEAKQQFENAATAYHKAIEAGDDVNVYVELAAAEEKLGKLDAAVRHLRRVVRAEAGVRPDVEKRASARLDELLARVGLVTLTVAPPGTSITLGGSEVGHSPLAEPLVLLPGTYTLAFQAAGFEPREAELRVDPGTESERAIELEPVKVVVEPVPPPAPEPAPRVEPSPRPSRLPLYAGAGLTVTAVAGAGALGALALREHATFTRRSTDAVDRDDARANGRLLAQLADVAIVTAVAAAGFTAYWYFYRYKRHHDNSRQSKLDVVPWVQPQLGGMTVAGRF